MKNMKTLLRFASALCLVGSCLGDDVPTNRSGSLLEAGAFVIDAGDDDGGVSGPVSGCPSSEPKTGDSCGPGTSESDTCEYPVGTCIASDGRELNETIVYCCPNGSWGVCGGRSPCQDDIDASVAPLEDAGPQSRLDAAGDANGDGGLDGGIDTATP
jgi:hypothetical protein